MTSEQVDFNSGDFRIIISDLIQKSGFPSGFTIKPLNGGRNNRVFCIIFPGGSKALLKAYFRHPNDARNRLKAEFSFMEFAWGKNIRCLPKPIAADFMNNIGLYEFIEGRKIESSEINHEKIRQALDFFSEINRHKENQEAKNLPVASEACFSIDDNLNHVKKRIEKLNRISSSSKVNRKALSFLKNSIIPEWEKSIRHLESFLHTYGIGKNNKISPEETCISPSDFGFHNALLKNNNLFFIDFEYAGWDDTAKMICDFFCQPEVKVPFSYFDFFIDTAGKKIKEHDQFRQKINALMPLYRVKWCCIMLNEFLATGSQRRSFAFGNNNLKQEKAKQLEKSKEYLEEFRLE